MLPLSFDIAALPTLSQVEQVVLGLRNGKAPGPDGITSEVLRTCTPVATRQLLPVLLKASLRLQEPAAWRGGNLVVLAKRACARLTCDNYRSVLVSCISAKVYHRCVRTGLKPYLLASQPAMQFGVRAGIGIETPALAIRSFVAMMDGLRKPWGVLFVDLAAAFYTVLRQSLVPNPDTDEGFLALLHALQLPAQAVSELYQHLQVAAELPAQGVQPHQVEIVRDLFVGSWFRLSTHPTLVLTHRGSRPGDPLADLLFAFTLSAYLRRVTELLAAAGLQTELPRPAPRPAWMAYCEEGIGNPAWADDFTWPIVAPGASLLVDHACKGTSLLLTHASSLGMTLKFGVEKTALLLPEAVKRDAAGLFSRDPHGDLCLVVHDGCRSLCCDLPVVASYKHLGGILVSNASPAPDLYHRFSRAEGTAKPLRRVFFGSRQFTVAVRRSLLVALVISKYTHTCAGLIIRAACHLRLWERHYLRLWRNITRPTAPEHQEHSLEVLRFASAVAPPLALAKSRAAFLTKLFSGGPSVLATLLVDHYALHPAASWLDQLRADVDYAALYLPRLRDVLPVGREVAGLVEAAQDSPQWWPQTLRRVEMLFFQDLSEWRRLRDRGDERQSTGPVLTVPAVAAAASGDKGFVCRLCQKAFQLRKQLHLHLAKTHGLLSPARHYALSDACSACGKFFGSVEQVQQHLKSSMKCLKRCSLLHPPLSKEQIVQVEAAGKRTAKAVRSGCWRTFEARPPPTIAPYTFGPLLPTAAESLLGLSEGEHLLLSDLRPRFEPSAAVTTWIEEYIAGKSVEGPRANIGSEGPHLSFREFLFHWHARIHSFGRALMRALESDQQQQYYFGGSLL